MKEQAFKDNYYIAYKTIMAEIAWRKKVFAKSPALMEKKVAEMQFVLALLVEMKDELKPHLEADWEQPRLLDVPRKAEYR